MNKPQKTVSRVCHKCGVELSQDPIAIRILERLDLADRPGTCANCAVDQGNVDMKAKA
jgi:hypothetical protein